MANWILELFKKWFPKTGEDGIDENNPRNGLIKSLPDFRDLQAKDILGSIDLSPLPKTYCIPYLLPVKQQGSKPLCVGETGATIKNEKERREKNDFNGDGEWLYNECKKVDGYNGPGTYFRTALDRLQKVGIKPLPESPVQGAPETFAIGGYAQVDCDFESLKRAILQFGAILIGFYGDNAGWKSAYINPPKNIEWGHAVSAIGFTEDYIIFQNSWGKEWGEQGIGYFSKDYLPFEAWCVLVDKLNIEKSEKPKYFFENDLYVGVDDNKDVRALQDCLRWLGCLPKEQVSTGIFGEITKKAVIIFQQRYNINLIGRVGPATRIKLNELFQ